MTLSSHKSSYKAQNCFAFGSTDMENKDNSDTFTITEPLGFEAFYYTMLNDYKDSLVFGDPFGPNKPFGPNVLMLYDRDKRTIHHVCIHFDDKSEKDIEDPLPYMLTIASRMKSDYYITFNTYWSLTDEAINQQAQQKKYCCPEHLPPEFKMEIINVVGRSLANENDKSSKRSSSIKEIDKTYEIIRERPGDQTSKVLDFNEL